MFIDEFLEKSEDVKKLLSIYKTEFTDSYKKLKKNQIKKRKAIIKYSQLIFIKWYFSTLIDNTYFSPCNIFNRIITERYGGEVTVVPNVTPIFIENELRDFKVNYRIFNLARLGLLDDIRKIQSLFKEKPVQLKKDSLDIVYDVYKDEIFIKEENYYHHLFQLALYLSALKIVKKNDGEVLSGSDVEISIFNEVKFYEPIINFILFNAEYSLGTILGGKNPYNQDYLKKMLKNKVVFEDLTKKLLKALDIKKGDFAKFFMNDLKGENNSIADNYFLGEIFLTKFFIMPLSYYIPILQPCYIETTAINDLFEEIIQADSNNESIDDVIFSPSMVYDLTRLGDWILNSKRRVKFQNIFDTKVNVDEIIIMKNEFKNNPIISDFWQNIDIKELEEFLNSLEEIEMKDEKPKKKFHKEGNVIHLFKKE